MLDFTFYNPTKIIFGKNTIASLSSEIPTDAKVLITYGGGSIKKNGVYDQVISALEKHQLFEFGGIEPNPTYETLMEALAIIKDQKIDYLLAVGGGSVIDGTKFLAAATYFEGVPWDILLKWAPLTKALPFATVLTLPATGSEMNSGSVVTRKETGDKLFFASPHVFPKFSILDPQATYSLPPRQVANGIVDAFVHTVEQYLTYPVNAPLQDYIAEGILKTLVDQGPLALENPENYDVRANIMWCATMALNGLIGSGVPSDWSTHMIGHELTAKYGLDHAQTLAIILPSVLNYKKDQKKEKLIRYAERVFGIEEANHEEQIDRAIVKTRRFFESLGVKTKISEYESTSKDDFPGIIDKLTEHRMVALGEHKDILPKDSLKILEESF